MTPEQRTQLQGTVSAAGLARVFRDLDDLGRRLARFIERYAERASELERGALPSPLPSIDGVIAEHRSNPYRVEVLLQAIAFRCTPDMLAMVWMVGLGCTIQALTVSYERRERAELTVELQLRDGSPLAFRSTEIWDLAVLRFVALATNDGAPEMSGFYPLPLPPAGS